MSRLTDLIAQVRQSNPALAKDLEAEVKVLSSRVPFGLNFERHLPETVQLPDRTVRRGDKVMFRAPRGQSDKGLDRRTWRVTGFNGCGDERTADLIDATPSDADPETAIRLLDDLVVVAEFRDPIYPGLRSTGRVERGGDKPFHTVINGENYHALEALLFAYEGQVDCIYIDPPYNTGANDWKYNNDYVDTGDVYRHSKWLAMMERRIKLAKRLLNPTCSVLIVTIDENEAQRIGILLGQTFLESRVQMISSVINPKGTARTNEFSRVEEYLFYVFIGSARLVNTGSDMLTDRDFSSETEVRWRGLARTGRKGLRPNNPGSWYPIYVDTVSGRIHSIGDSVQSNQDDSSIPIPEGTVAVWPPSMDGQQYSWSTIPATLRDIHSRGGLKTGRINFQRESFPFYYLSSNMFDSIQRGDIEVTGRGPQGELLVSHAEGLRSTAPKTIWNKVSHDAGSHGTGLIRNMMPNRRFPFPKSLYAVEDAIRFFVKAQRNALILDFFAGSGTTTHAVMRLNRQDGGHRRSILVTNNEVSADEQRTLHTQGLRDGDPEWERLGIAEYITKPRIRAAITGRTPDGQPIKGDYRFTDEFPMAEGFEENAEFFDLTYEEPRKVAHHRSFLAIAPLLWLRAGAEGRRIEQVDGFDVAETYGVLVDLDQSRAFVAQIEASGSVRIAFVVTDDDRRFQMICAGLPERVEPVRLYESYLTNFEINTGRGEA